MNWGIGALITAGIAFILKFFLDQKSLKEQNQELNERLFETAKREQDANYEQAKHDADAAVANYEQLRSEYQSANPATTQDPTKSK